MRPLPVMALGVVLLTASALVLAGCDTRIRTTTGQNTEQNSYTITEPVEVRLTKCTRWGL